MDTEQAVPFTDIVAWQEKMFLFSNYLYYVLDKPYLSDDGYDSIVKFLERHYDMLSDRVKAVAPPGGLKAAAHALTNLSTDEILEAHTWAKWNAVPANGWK